MHRHAISTPMRMKTPMPCAVRIAYPRSCASARVASQSLDVRENVAILELPAELPVHVVGDQQRLRQVQKVQGTTCKGVTDKLRRRRPAAAAAGDLLFNALKFLMN